MNDIDIKTNLKKSEVNGLYNEIEVSKNKRKEMKEIEDTKTLKIIEHIEKNGSVLAYKNDTPHILTVKKGTSKKFDRAALAQDTQSFPAALNAVGIAELVEDRKITSKKLQEYFYTEPTTKLHAKKANKNDIAILGGKQ